MRIKRLALYACAISCLICTTPAHADQDANAFVQGESTLESRLLAPCCWNQTLDVHESDLARSLRGEIRQRLQNGESSDSIEADIVGRYGEKVRAVPKGKSLTAMGAWLSIALALAGLGAGALVLRWAKRGRGGQPSQVPSTSTAAPADPYDERLDAELRDLDE